MYLGNLNLISINTSMRERSVYMGGVGIVWGGTLPHTFCTCNHILTL
jgi:hypothetical protein